MRFSVTCTGLLTLSIKCFRSLYEIPKILSLWSSPALPSFRSLYEIPRNQSAIPPNTIIVSVLFMRFRAHFGVLNLGELPGFRSLYEIPEWLAGKDNFAYQFPFSLWDSQRQTRETQSRRKKFPFSLWDSNDEGRVWANVGGKVSVLFMRFLQQKESIREKLR